MKMDWTARHNAQRDLRMAQIALDQAWGEAARQPVVSPAHRQREREMAQLRREIRHIREDLQRR